MVDIVVTRPNSGLLGLIAPYVDLFAVDTNNCIV